MAHQGLENQSRSMSPLTELGNFSHPGSESRSCPSLPVRYSSRQTVQVWCSLMMDMVGIDVC